MNARCIERAQLDANTVDSMFDLMGRYFENIPRDQFDADLARKSHVILLESESNELKGCTTLDVGSYKCGNSHVSVIYSGDTIVDATARGSTILSRAWISLIDSLCDIRSGRPCYWLLIVSGYRTYRFLPVFWNKFYPRDGKLIPKRLEDLKHRLAIKRFGDYYDPVSGIVRFAIPQRLRTGLSDIPVCRLKDPDIAFFASANPGHAKGDELVCITELSYANLTKAGQRMLHQNVNHVQVGAD